MMNEQATRLVTINISNLHFRVKKLKGFENLSEKEFRDMEFAIKERIFSEMFVRLKVTSVKELVMERGLEKVTKMNELEGRFHFY